MKGWGIIYWNPTFYQWTMALLRSKEERTELRRRLAQEIGTRSVLELCCGSDEVFRAIPGSAYQGIDKNPAFVREMARRGRRVVLGDVMTADWPAAECLVMVDSLYHFMPDQDRLMDRIRAHPCDKVIIAEPVRNVLSRLPGPLRSLGSWLTRVDGRHHPERFTEESLREFFQRFGFQSVSFSGANGIGVLNKHG